MVDPGIRTLFLRCTDGRFTDKLEPTTVVEFGFEPKPPVSKTDMLNRYTTQHRLRFVRESNP